MKAMKRLGIIAVVIIVLVVVVGLMLPQDYVVSREIVIAAPADQVHAYVGELKKWDDWGPWKDGDPTVEVTLGEKTTGVGASQSWTADSGDGKLVFTQCDASAGIAYDMEFADWDEGCKASVTYQAQGEGTLVTWEMTGSVPTPVIGGYFARMMPGMISPMFELGLQKLKTCVEKELIEETEAEESAVDQPAGQAS